MIPWEAIAGIDRRSIKRQSFLCLHLRDPASYPSSTLIGRMSALSRGMGFGHVSLSATGTDRSFDELEDVIAREYRAWLDRQGEQR